MATLERRLSALVWNYKQRGEVLDRRDRHISEVMAGIRRQHGRPPAGKEAVLAADLLAMLDTLPHDLRGLRDRAILLVGLPAACAAARSSASIAHPTKPTTEPAGLRSRRRVCS